jgi:hypothetical protein
LHLAYDKDYYLSIEPFIQLDTKNYKSFNIYITSDEEIKEGDWIFDIVTKRIEIAKFNHNDLKRDWKKIILTTDQDLINDGVQAIDDEFLEWWIKNPSCESVEVEKYHGINTSIAEVNYIAGDGSLSWQGKNDLRDYKIIIPTEEPNPLTVGKEFYESADKNITVYKQETLEEAANHYAEGFEYKQPSEHGLFVNSFQGFISGAKWQQEQDKNKYSEEEVLVKLYECLGHFAYQHNIVINGNEIDKWFEQFKKK